MISPEGLKHLNREAAVAAAERNAEPVLLGLEDWTAAISEIIQGNVPEWFRNMPFLGDIEDWREACAELGEEPAEYEIVEEIFHDITGHNLRDAGGPALSIWAYANKCLELCKEHGPLWFAITNGYQFQAYTAAMKRAQ